MDYIVFLTLLLVTVGAIIWSKNFTLSPALSRKYPKNFEAVTLSGPSPEQGTDGETDTAGYLDRHSCILVLLIRKPSNNIYNLDLIATA